MKDKAYYCTFFDGEYDDFGNYGIVYAVNEVEAEDYILENYPEAFGIKIIKNEDQDQNLANQL